MEEAAIDPATIDMLPVENATGRGRVDIHQEAVAAVATDIRRKFQHIILLAVEVLTATVMEADH